MKPKLTEEASEVIAEEYSKLRSEDMLESDVARTQPVTARTLETMIRLSTAHAKARLSKNVTAEDAQAAIELIQFAYFKRVLEREKKKRRRHDSEVSIDSNEGEDGRGTKRLKKNHEKSGETEHDPYEYKSDTDMSIDENVRIMTRSHSAKKDVTSSSKTSQDIIPQSSEVVMEELPPTITEDRLKAFRTLLYKLFQEQRTQSVPLSRVHEYLDAQHSPKFTSSEITAAITKMTDDNQIMSADDNIFLI